MKDLQALVYKFMEREEVTLKQALLQASIGMSAKSGDVAEIVRGVVFNNYPYSEERKKQNAEFLGEILFYWLMLASTCDMSPEDIMQEYIASYIARNKLMREDEIQALRASKQVQEKEAKASILELLKYVKGEQQLDELNQSILQMRQHLKTQEKTYDKV